MRIQAGFTLITLLFLVTLQSGCQVMDVSEHKSICEALQTIDKRTVAKAVNRFLKTLNDPADRDRNFETILNWLKKETCVQNAYLIDRIIQTDPPIVQFRLGLSGTEPHNLILKITFNGEYRFYDLITDN